MKSSWDSIRPFAPAAIVFAIGLAAGVLLIILIIQHVIADQSKTLHPANGGVSLSKN